MVPFFAAERCESAVCENAHEGMGSSLACAVRPAGKADGYVVALADMPFVRPTTIAAVRDALGVGAHLAAPTSPPRAAIPWGSAARSTNSLIPSAAAKAPPHPFAPQEPRPSRIPAAN